MQSKEANLMPILDYINNNFSLNMAFDWKVMLLCLSLQRIKATGLAGGFYAYEWCGAKTFLDIRKQHPT